MPSSPRSLLFASSRLQWLTRENMPPVWQKDGLVHGKYDSRVMPFIREDASPAFPHGRPAGFFRYEGGERWTPLETPNGKRVEALCVHNDQLFASTYDQAHIFRYDGKTWVDCGQVGDETNTQTYSFAVHYGRLYVGTWRSGKVFRYESDNRWIDCGRLGEELEVMGMLVHNGSLFRVAIDLGPDKDIYVARVDWAKDGKTVYVQRLNRVQDRLDMLAVDPATGKIYGVEIFDPVKRTFTHFSDMRVDDLALPWTDAEGLAGELAGGHLERFEEGDDGVALVIL